MPAANSRIKVVWAELDANTLCNRYTDSVIICIALSILSIKLLKAKVVAEYSTEYIAQYTLKRTRSTQLNKEQKNFTLKNHANLAFLCRGVNLRFIDSLTHHTHTCIYSPYCTQDERSCLMTWKRRLIVPDSIPTKRALEQWRRITYHLFCGLTSLPSICSFNLLHEGWSLTTKGKHEYIT